MATNYEALLGRGAGAKTTNPGRNYETLLGRTGNSYSYTPAPQIAPPNPLEQKVLNSFNTLPDAERNATLGRLQTAASRGDQGAQRKIQLLTKYQSQKAPTTPQYKNSASTNFWNGAAGFANGAAEFALSPFEGGTAGEASVVRQKGKPPVVQAGSSSDIPSALAAHRPDIAAQGARDQAIQGIEARLLYGKGPRLASALPAIANSGKVAKFVGKTVDSGISNAGANVAASSTSQNAQELSKGSGKNLSVELAKAAGEGFGYGAGFHVGGAAVKGAAKGVMRFINGPEFVPKENPNITTPEGQTHSKSLQNFAVNHYPDLQKQYLARSAVPEPSGKGFKQITLNTDDWRDLLPGHRGTNSAETHLAASMLNNGLFADALHSQKGKGNKTVLVLAGGGGSGKSTAVGQFGQSLGHADFPIVYDGTTSNYKNLFSRLSQPAAKAGFATKVLFVDRNPVSAAEGVVGRALHARANGEPARTVPLHVAIKDNLGARATMVQLIKDHPDMFHGVIDNNGKRGTARLITDRAEALDYLSQKRYNEGEITKEVANGLTRQNIPEDIRQGLVTPGTELDRHLQLQRAGGRPQEGRAAGSTTSADTSRSVQEAPKAQPASAVADELKKQADRQAPTAEAPKPVAQDVGETLSTPEASSRVKQYEESLKAAIEGVEKAPGYQAELAAKGGGEVISNKETYHKAQQLGPLPNETIKNWQATSPSDSVTIVRAKATLDAEAKSFTDKWQSGDLTPEQVDQAAEELAKLEAGYHVMTAEPARATQIQSTFVAKELEKAQNLKKLLKETKGPNREEIIKKGVEEFAKEADKAEKSGVFSAETAHKITSMFAEYATAAKLTSPLTHLVNIASSLITLPQRAAEGTVSAALGHAQGRTSIAQAKYTFGTMAGLRSASMQFAKDMRTSVTYVGKNRLGEVGGSSKSENVKPAIPGTVGKVVRTPFNFLSAADNFFKNILRDSELHQLAFAQAFKEGHTGAERVGRISELVSSPTPEMIARADKVAKEFTFQAEPGPLAKGIGQVLGQRPLWRLEVPFVMTPTNIAKFQIQRSAVGILAPRNIKDLMVKGVTRDDAIARLAVGAGLSYAGWTAVMASGDNITGAAPTAPGEKDNFYNSGRKPYSIKIGSSWVQYNRFQPIGLYLSQAVNLRDALARGDSKTAGNIFSSMAVGTAKSIADLPFVSGVSSLISALNDPTNQSLTNKAVGGVLTGLIPNVSRDIASFGDNAQRSAKTITDQVKLMIPGFVPGFNRNQVSPRPGTFGGNQPNAGSPVQRGFVKIVSPDQSTPLSKALDEIGKDTGYYPQAPGRNVKVHGKVLDPAAYDSYERRSGAILKTKLQKALDDAAFKGESSDNKAADVQDMVRQARTQAATELFGKAPKAAPRKAKHY